MYDEVDEKNSYIVIREGYAIKQISFNATLKYTPLAQCTGSQSLRGRKASRIPCAFMSAVGQLRSLCRHVLLISTCRADYQHSKLQVVNCVRTDNKECQTYEKK